MKKVLFLLPSTMQFYSGVGKYTFDLINVLKDSKKFKIEILTDNLFKNNVNLLKKFCANSYIKLTILTGQRKNFFMDPYSPLLKAYILKINPSILILSSWANSYTNLTGLITSLKNKSPKLVYIPYYQPAWSVPTDIKIQLLNEFVNQLMVTLSHVVITVSPYEKNLFMKNKYLKNKIKLVYPCLDKKYFQDQKFKKKKQIVWIGDCREPRKNLPLFLNIAYEIYKLDKDYKFIIVGKDSDKLTLQDEISDNNFKKNIIRTGYVSEKEKIKILSESLALMNTSTYEAFGIPLIEAMARKSLVIVPNMKTTSSFLKRELYYMYDLKTSYKSIAKEVFAILENEKLLNHKVNLAYKFCFENFNIKKFQNRVLKIFNEL